MQDTPEQTAIFKAGLETNTSLMINAYAGTGKALRNDQLVLTPTGFVAISSISIGDLIIGRDGKHYPVIGVYPQDISELYELKFSDGTSVVSDANHLWPMKKANDRTKLPYRIMTTHNLFLKPTTAAGPKASGNGQRTNWWTLQCAPVDFKKNQQKLPIDPWLLGVLLGDGCLQEKSISFSSADSEIVEEVKVIIAADYHTLKVNRTVPGGYDYRIVTNDLATGMPGRPGIFHPMLTQLRAMGLGNVRSSEKFIPSMYRLSSPAERLELLKGLFDTDAHSGVGIIEYSTSSLALIQDVRFIVESLGGTMTITERKTTHKIAYRGFVKLPNGTIPFKLARKIKSFTKRNTEPYRALKSVVKVESALATCIEVASPDKLYLTNNFIPTHNTTTITELAVRLDAAGRGGGVALAFNTKIKQELERRFPKTFTVMTLNGLGHRAWGRAIGKSLRLEERKLGLLVTEALKPYSLPKETWDDVRRLVTGAMQKGLVPSTYPHKGLLSDTVGNWSNIADDLWISANETTMQLARAVLINSIKQAFDGVISFDDQIYCSTMLGGVFPRFDLVLGDEAQDWSPLNHIQLAKTASDRIIAVGDPKQSLYAFRGADSSSMTNLRRLRKEWIDLPLATTFRCPKVIVARQQIHAPGFLAYHANPDGAVFNGYRYTLREGELEFGTRAKDSVEITWTWPDVQALGFEKVAILSRNNAQLISMAFKLLRQQIGVRMQGRDIGKGLIALSKKITPKDETPAGECANAIEKWKNLECDLAYANSHEEKVAGITDRAESLMAVLESAMVETAGQLRKQLEYLFSKDTGQVILSTVHRSKGLQWPLVIALDPWRIPSKFARKAAAAGNPTPLDQENNARYVLETRAQQVLVLVNLQDFQ